MNTMSPQWIDWFRNLPTTSPGPAQAQAQTKIPDAIPLKDVDPEIRAIVERIAPLAHESNVLREKLQHKGFQVHITLDGKVELRRINNI